MPVSMNGITGSTRNLDLAQARSRRQAFLLCSKPSISSGWSAGNIREVCSMLHEPIGNASPIRYWAER
jgi:hypothetical protein